MCMDSVRVAPLLFRDATSLESPWWSNGASDEVALASLARSLRWSHVALSERRLSPHDRRHVSMYACMVWYGMALYRIVLYCVLSCIAMLYYLYACMHVCRYACLYACMPRACVRMCVCACACLLNLFISDRNNRVFVNICASSGALELLGTVPFVAGVTGTGLTGFVSLPDSRRTWKSSTNSKPTTS